MSTPSVVIIEPPLQLRGELKVNGDVVLRTTFQGRLRVRGKLTIASCGEMRNEVVADALLIESGAKVKARLRVGNARPVAGLFWRLMRGFHRES